MRLRALLAAAVLFCVSCAGSVQTPPDAPNEPELIGGGASGGGESQAVVNLQESVVTQTYAVGGATIADVRTGLNRNGPYSTDAGRRYDGATSWDLRWSFRYLREPDACSLAAATLELSVVMVLPELAQPEALPPEVVGRWQGYRSALEAHELGHVSQSRAGAGELADTFRDAPAFASCRELAAYLTATGEAKLAEVRAADRRYDLETDHGREQGAVFP